MNPEPQLFWKTRHWPPLKMNRQTRCPELEELDFFEELDDPDALDVREALDDPEAVPDPLEGPGAGPEIPVALDDRGEFDDRGTVIELDDMALPLKDAG